MNYSMNTRDMRNCKTCGKEIIPAWKYCDPCGGIKRRSDVGRNSIVANNKQRILKKIKRGESIESDYQLLIEILSKK